MRLFQKLDPSHSGRSGEFKLNALKEPLEIPRFAWNDSKG